MQLPLRLARPNRRVTSPILRRWARTGPDKGIPEHVGRKSGKPYRTPLTVFPTQDGVANVVAAGGAQMQRRGPTFGVADPRVVPRAQAAPLVPDRWRPIFERLSFA